MCRWTTDGVHPPGALEQVLRDGLRLLESQADAKWQHVRAEIVDRTAGEKVVLFAQPIETVTALAAYLERIDGRRPAMIIGGQNSDERMRQVEAFYDPDGPRFLVSSKGGVVKV
jgi:superfamily II DNA or RNA helicase